MDSNANPPTTAPARVSAATLWLYVLGLLMAFALIGGGVYLLLKPHNLNGWLLIASGGIATVVVLATYPLALAAHRANLCAQSDAEGALAGVNERLDQMSILMNLISDQQLLSERAKMIAYRDKDRDALRRAIGEEMARQDWGTASALAEEVERYFGKHEAERMRQDINSRRGEQTRRLVGEAMVVVDRHTRSEQWQEAMREAQRLTGLYPDSEQVRDLPQEIERRRQEHKKRLLDSWNDAVARHDVDGSIEILKQLDPYLTPAEGAAMQDTARTVFKEKLNNLGRQFSAAVQEHRWREAISHGEAIMREFPNTRMAQEVREKLDGLRARAGESAPAGAAS